MLNRRRFLKYAAGSAAVAGVSALGLDYLTKLTYLKQIQSLNQTSSSIAPETITTSSSTTAFAVNMPQTPTRLLATVKDFQRVWQLVQSDPLARRYYAKLQGDADSILNQPVYEYHLCPPSECKDDVPNILSISRGVVKRIYTLGLMYRLTGDQGYLWGAWAELNSAAAFPDWNHENSFLDTAEMTHAFAIGYDWFPWNDDQRKVLRDAIVEKGLKPALQAYQGARFGWWVNSDSNWNQVCNGGAGMGALALLPELPSLCGEVLNHAVKSLPTAMKSFAPDGGWPEGPVYWGYATLYNCILLAALESALQTDYGLSQLPGFSETGYFPIYITSPTGSTFNFADAHPEATDSPQRFWLARKVGRGVYAWFARTLNSINSGLDCGGPCIGRPLGLLWFDSEGGDPQTERLSPNRYFKGVEVVTLRSRWGDGDATFVGFTAGSNRANHGHLDAGSFVLDALNRRWAVDLGPDAYSLPGYFNTSGRRWTYYRMRAEGHNTLVINPSSNPDQSPNAYPKITRFEPNTTSPFAIADLKTAYYSRVPTLERGIALLDGKQVVVQDEIAPNPLDVWWFMHTYADIQLNDAKNLAVLPQGGMRLWCAILQPQKSMFSVLDAKPLPSSPNPTGQAPNSGARKLAINIPNTGLSPLTISVLMAPLRPEEQPPTQLPPVTPLANW